MAEQPKWDHPPLILIANPLEWSARSLESILDPHGYTVVRAYTGLQVLHRAKNAQPDLILLDDQLPDYPGLDICRRLLTEGIVDPSTPIIMTTARASGRVQRLEAYRAGAWEYLGQPLDGEALVAKVARFLAARCQTHEAERSSLVDRDTGLYNMRGLARRAREIGSEASRLSQPVACIAFAPLSEAGIDPMHRPDDALLPALNEAVGRLLRSSVRASDVAGRLSGSEFAVIAPATGPEGALRFGNRLQERFRSDQPAGNGATEGIQLGIGYSAVGNLAEASLDPLEIMLRATTALRQLTATPSGGMVRAFEPQVD